MFLHFTLNVSIAVNITKRILSDNPNISLVFPLVELQREPAALRSDSDKDSKIFL